MAWSRRPENPVGALMVVIGLDLVRRRSCCATGRSRSPLTAGIWLGDLWLLPLAFLLAGFPLVRLESTLDRVIIGALAIVAIPLEFALADVPELRQLRRARRAAATRCMIADAPRVADAVDTVQRVILIVALVTLAVVLVRR